MNDSLQQVHSWKCIQTTAGFSFFSKAETTWATPERLDPGHGGGRTAELQEIAAAVAFLLHALPNGLTHALPRLREQVAANPASRQEVRCNAEFAWNNEDEGTYPKIRLTVSAITHDAVN